MGRARDLVVVADDYGIGPETSRGVLDLAAEGRITATVLLVNCANAADAVAAWAQAPPEQRRPRHGQTSSRGRPRSEPGPMARALRRL